MLRLRALFSSIVIQATCLTVISMFFLLVLFWLGMQTPLADSLHKRALADNADSIAELAWLMESSPKELQPFILSAYRGGGRSATMVGEFADDMMARPDFLSEMQLSQIDVASRFVERGIRFRTLNASQLRKLALQPVDIVRPSSLPLISAVEVWVPIKEDQILLVRLAPVIVLTRDNFGLGSFVIRMLLFATALGLALAAVIFGPIRRLEFDAERTGLAETSETISENVPVELRHLTRVLNSMLKRLGNLIREREQILAAIAHDIRTGLTRLRLRFDESDVVSYSAIKSDLVYMETLVSDMLAYTRAESPNGPRELIRLEAFIKQFVESLPLGLTIDMNSHSDPFEIAGDPVALRRLFDNLIENARRYGDGVIHIKVATDEASLVVTVLDNGPGLPEDQLETIFEPFFRLEASRSRNTGGSGLGLGIARAIAQAHGASLKLENSPGCGLAAIVCFPNSLRT